MRIKSKKRLQITGKQLKALQERVKERELVDTDWELIQGLTETFECLSQALAEKDTSIGRLCKYLLGAPTETAKNVLKDLRHSTSENKSEKVRCWRNCKTGI